MRQALARAVYSVLLQLLSPLYVLRLWRRGRHEPLYRQAMCERFGRYAPGTGAGAVGGWCWVHAVSLGETHAAASLVDALRVQWPGCRVLLTHSTATGRAAGAALLRDGDAQVWLPYDTPGATRRFMRSFQPRIGVLMETEVWPNLLAAAANARVPMVLANARLSEKSLRRGQHLQALIVPAVRGLAMVLAQTRADAERLRIGGAERVQVCGNLKFDVTPDASVLARGQSWRQGVSRPVVLAASTREGEEKPLLDAWAALPAPRPLLVVVPRHPQRFDEVAALIRSGGLSLARRSEWLDAAPPEQATQADVWLGDSMGEMPAYYALADVALLGGSFARLGGQNLIEAAACGCAVVMGPHTFNFAQASELSLAAGAALRVADLPDGVATAVALAGSAQCVRMSELAHAFALAHRGAAQRMAKAIAGLMQRTGQGASSLVDIS